MASREVNQTGVAIAYRCDFGDGSSKLYVSELPGQGGVDWGYTPDSQRAAILSPYWQRRFKADTRRVGHVAYFDHQ